MRIFVGTKELGFDTAGFARQIYLEVHDDRKTNTSESVLIKTTPVARRLYLMV